MTASFKPRGKPRLVVQAETAAEVMTANPVSLRDVATVREAIALLTDKGFSAAPVIDEAGKPIGVLSRADILVHDREMAEYLPPRSEYYHQADLTLDSGETLRSGFQVEKFDATLVRDLMTPVVFSVAPEAPVARVVEDMLALKVHRLFVVDDNGVLIGVISALDVLRRLLPERPALAAASVKVCCSGEEPLGYEPW
jgi:CBS domain-containing protein